MLHNTIISFSYLQDEKGNKMPELINDFEFQLQSNLVENYNFANCCVGDGDAGFNETENRSYEIHISYNLDPVMIKLDDNILS